MTDRGIPRAWANMNGYFGRTCLWENPSGLRFWVKYHWKTEQGIANLTDAEAKAIAAEDPDFHVRGLRTAIARGEQVGTTTSDGVLVTRAEPGGPAAAAGISSGCLLYTSPSPRDS